MPDATPPAPTPAPAPVAPATAPTPATPTPDALKIPYSFRRGATKYDRIDSICSLAEPILGADPAKGQRAYIRKQLDKMFVTLDPMDEMRFRATSGHSGSRYNWVMQADGIEYGYLVDAAKEPASA